MLRRIGFGFLWGFVGYLCGAFGGGWLVTQMSSNTFDGGVEAAMTGAFVFGPLVGLIAFVIAAWRAGSAPSRAAS
jgi:hypothetical protein